ncbi:MAG: four-helix bundle copper-binding protein [Candidatus Binataceae bacterium]
MERREFLIGLGAAAAVISVSQGFAQSTSAPGVEQMHAPKYKALAESCSHSVAAGEDCLRHCFGMLSMNDTSMVGCTKSIYDMVAVCGALQSLAAVNSPHTPTLAKAVADICGACQKQCEKFPNILECKACAQACESCTDECRKVAT